MRPALFLCPVLISLLFLLSGLTLISGCNKALCASDVSKCLLQLKDLDVSFKTHGSLAHVFGEHVYGNCSCCKECMLCLSSLWEECCDCVGMCNPRNYNDSPATSKSTVEELYRPIPSLSLIISSSPSLLSPRPLLHVLFLCSHSSDGLCTVVYFDDCVSIRQCKQYCESMGGSKYRWFHNACCECIGPECLDYGSKAVKCMNCLI
ncbi:twisted gastrulation protein homolog 1-A-like [Sinocyclocheilus anshuiensis]|uniref:twisted gastrulation protein homolog 1-A-like n=1 Tax=Sinocyclocheilus anshuiensis TaxID=1608454 RepID=UPI0007BA7268|nr:PREDICTED: twisted gastrulation protein homolog 1-A-like [Sinocyclocheilus anshuiensis]